MEDFLSDCPQLVIYVFLWIVTALISLVFSRKIMNIRNSPPHHRIEASIWHIVGACIGIFIYYILCKHNFKTFAWVLIIIQIIVSIFGLIAIIYLVDKYNKGEIPSSRGPTLGPGGTQRPTLGPGGTQRPTLGPGGTQRPTLGPGGTQRPTLGPGGTQQHNLGPGGTQQHNLGPGGTQQHNLGPGGTQRPTLGPGGTQRPTLGPGGTQRPTLGPGGTQQHNLGPGGILMN